MGSNQLSFANFIFHSTFDADGASSETSCFNFLVVLDRDLNPGCIMLTIKRSISIQFFVSCQFSELFMNSCIALFNIKTRGRRHCMVRSRNELKSAKINPRLYFAATEQLSGQVPAVQV